MAKTFKEFVEEHNVHIKCRRVDPYAGEIQKWGSLARHWVCTLMCGNVISIRFHQGKAHTKPPTAEDVLYCIALDHHGDQPFSDWARDFCYDLDDDDIKRDAWETYLAIRKQTKDAKYLLGTKRFNELLECEEE